MEPFDASVASLIRSDTTYPFGKFELEAYENNTKSPFKIVLEIKNEKDKDGLFIINGQGTVNFYFAQFEADFAQQSMSIHGVGSTTIEGPDYKSKFESEYLDRLSRATGYSFNKEGDKLTLHLNEDQKMIYLVDKN